MIKKYYTLFNTSKKVYLEHPKVGLWFSETREEAEDMLNACLHFLESIKLSDVCGHIEIRELEEEIV